MTLAGQSLDQKLPFRHITLDEQNNASCIGEIDDNDIILYDIKNKFHNESSAKSR